MTAPDLSPAEASIVARFDAAPTPPEVLREMLIGDVMAAWDDWDGEDEPEGPREWAERSVDVLLRSAALAVFRDQQDPVTWRVGQPDPTPAWRAEHRPLVECYATDSVGWLCTWGASADHPAWHVAGTGDEILAVWPVHS